MNASSANFSDMVFIKEGRKEGKEGNINLCNTAGFCISGNLETGTKPPFEIPAGV